LAAAQKSFLPLGAGTLATPLMLRQK